MGMFGKIGGCTISGTLNFGKIENGAEPAFSYYCYHQSSERTLAKPPILNTERLPTELWGSATKAWMFMSVITFQIKVLKALVWHLSREQI